MSVLVTNGTCEYTAGGPLTSFDECWSAIMGRYGLGAPLQRIRESSTPPFCYIKFIDAQAAHFYFNTAQSSAAECTDARQCVCAFSSPPPPSPPFPPNLAPLPPPPEPPSLPPPAPPPGRNYVVIDRGSCQTNAAGPVTSVPECEMAAERVGLPQITVGVPLATPDLPPDCIFYEFWNSWLGFNTAQTNTTCSLDQKCICVAHLPILPLPPFPPNSAPLPPPPSTPLPLSPPPSTPPPPPVPPGSREYVVITEGRCDTMAGGYVTSAVECEAAAVWLGLLGPHAMIIHFRVPPPHCLLTSYDELIYNAETTSRDPCSESTHCICVANSPPSPPLPPFPPNLAPLPPPPSMPMSPSPPPSPPPPPPVPPGSRAYVSIDRGSCDTMAGGPVTSRTECEGAAHELGVDYLTLQSNFRTYTKPPFCWYHTTYDHLYFNGITESPIPCSTTTPCICVGHSPPPDPPLPPLPSPPQSFRGQLVIVASSVGVPLVLLLGLMASFVVYRKLAHRRQRNVLLLEQQRASDKSFREQMEAVPVEERVTNETQRDQCSFWFCAADFLRTFRGDGLPAFQELLEDFPGALHQECIHTASAFQGDHAHKYCVVSHRWMTQAKPDPGGEQLRAVQEHLEANPEIEWVWYECVPLPKPLAEALLLPHSSTHARFVHTASGACRSSLSKSRQTRWSRRLMTIVS